MIHYNIIQTHILSGICLFVYFSKKDLKFLFYILRKCMFEEIIVLQIVITKFFEKL